MGIFKKDIGDIDNRRLQRYREQLLPYVFDISWTAGKKHQITDAFSRNPVDGPDNLASTVKYVASMPKSISAKVLEAACSDWKYQQVIDAIISRISINDLPPTHPANEFKSFWSLLSVSSDNKLIIYDGSKVVVPSDSRHKVIDFLHSGHAGYARTKQLAQNSYFWPRMTSQIRQTTDSCRECLTLRPKQQRETMQPSKASYPMDMVAADLFTLRGKNYLCMTDRFSGNCWVQPLKSTTTSTITDTLTNWFLDLGIPSSIRTDGGPQFRRDFREYCEKLDIKREKSSAYYAQSNGLAESAVKNMKRLLKKCQGSFTEFKRALLVWRNTPKDYGFSPAELFYGFTQNFGQNLTRSPYIDRQKASDLKEQLKDKKTANYNKHAHDLSQLPVGTAVLIRNPKTNEYDTQGKITSIRRSGRSYNVITDDLFESIRNRRNLIVVSP